MLSSARPRESPRKFSLAPKPLTPVHTISHTNGHYSGYIHFYIQMMIMLNYARYNYAKKQCWHNRAAPRTESEFPHYTNVYTYYTDVYVRLST